MNKAILDAYLVILIGIASGFSFAAIGVQINNATLTCKPPATKIAVNSLVGQVFHCERND